MRDHHHQVRIDFGSDRVDRWYCWADLDPGFSSEPRRLQACNEVLQLLPRDDHRLPFIEYGAWLPLPDARLLGCDCSQQKRITPSEYAMSRISVSEGAAGQMEKHLIQVRLALRNGA